MMKDKTAIIIIYASTFMEINLESFVAEETPQTSIQNPFKHLRRNFLQK